jgi:hypothetical protein
MVTRPEAWAKQQAAFKKTLQPDTRSFRKKLTDLFLVLIVAAGILAIFASSGVMAYLAFAGPVNRVLYLTPTILIMVSSIVTVLTAAMCATVIEKSKQARQ